MPSEIRVDTINNRSGLGTITVSDTGAVFAGVTTFTSASVGSNGINGGQLGGSRNIIINGSMVVNQRGWTGAAGTGGDGAYTTDRFLLNQAHDGVVSVGQTTLTSTTGGNAYADGFQNAHILRVTTADTSLAAGQFQNIQQRIEGYNVQGIKKGTANALPVTLSFWVRSTTTGTYIAELYDNDNTRQVSQAYTINAANTWEKKALTFPADTTGVFDNDNALSLYVIWWLAAGSTYSGGTLNTSWAANTNANRVVGQVNALGTVGDFWLTGVQLEVGSQATPFERRPYGQELALCQRYYQTQRIDYLSYLGLYSSGSDRFYGPPVSLMTEMRASPTITYGLILGANYWVNPGVSAHSANSTNGMTLYANTKSWRMSQARQAGNNAAVGQTVYIWEPEFLITLSIEL